MRVPTVLRPFVAAVFVGALVPLLAAPATAGQPRTAVPAVRPSAYPNWHVSPSLDQLRREVNARWPGRSRSSDGTLGDMRHRLSVNDHNPVGYPGGPAYGTRGAVHAIDITSSGIDTATLLAAVIGDQRVEYVIYDRRIWSRGRGWTARTYTGDPHRTHVHISLRGSSRSAAVAAENDTSRWIGSSTSGSSNTSNTSNSTASSMSRPQVVTLQKALIGKGHRIPAGATGVYGSQTRAAVASFQRSQGWSGSGADGVAGSLTLRRLGVTGSTSRSNSVTVVPISYKSGSPSPAAGTPTSGTYKIGARGSKVTSLQEALIRRGYRITPGATGYFGPSTRSAVTRFQRAQGWSGSSADGIPGAQTLRRLGLS